jgi:ABC-type multidrug transport system ATPase subunit
VTDAVIDIRDLRKSFAGVRALDGLTLSVPKGSIFALLGPNGAGKTTAIKILFGLVRATGGTARVFDLPVDDPAASVAIRRRAALVSEEKDLIDSMTVDEIMRFTARAVPGWRDDLAKRYCTQFDLHPQREVRALSRGARTTLALLLALCRTCDLLVLDEPTAGLDPAASEQVLQAIVRHVAEDGVTVCFSTHQLAEVEQIADHIAILNRGRTALAGPLDDLRSGWRRLQLVFDGEPPPLTFRSTGVTHVRRDGRVLAAFVRAGIDQVVDEARSWNPAAVDVTPVTLKEIFLETINTEH